MTGYSQYGLAFEQFEESFCRSSEQKPPCLFWVMRKTTEVKNTGVSVVEKIGNQASHLIG
jgi:hypothetical protein